MNDRGAAPRHLLRPPRVSSTVCFFLGGGLRLGCTCNFRLLRRAGGRPGGPPPFACTRTAASPAAICRVGPALQSLVRAMMMRETPGLSLSLSLPLSLAACVYRSTHVTRLWVPADTCDPAALHLFTLFQNPFATHATCHNRRPPSGGSPCRRPHSSHSCRACRGGSRTSFSAAPSDGLERAQHSRRRVLRLPAPRRS
jgi:hypothetical protein